MSQIFSVIKFWISTIGRKTPLFHHPEDLFIEHSSGEHVPAIFLLRIIDFRFGIVLFQIAAQLRESPIASPSTIKQFRQSAHK